MYISASVINTSVIGDAIAAFRILIIGRIMDEATKPELYLEPSDASVESSIFTHTDGNKNIEWCSIVVIGKDKLNLDIYSRSLRVPLPLAIARDYSITSAYVIIHPTILELKE